MVELCQLIFEQKKNSEILRTFSCIAATLLLNKLLWWIPLIPNTQKEMVAHFVRDNERNYLNFLLKKHKTTPYNRELVVRKSISGVSDASQSHRHNHVQVQILIIVRYWVIIFFSTINFVRTLMDCLFLFAQLFRTLGLGVSQQNKVYLFAFN